LSISEYEQVQDIIDNLVTNSCESSVVTTIHEDVGNEMSVTVFVALGF